MVSKAEVEALTDAYRGAMREGDSVLGGSDVERKILQAMVASSAADTSRWIKTRVPQGDKIAGPLDILIPELQDGNVVGQGLEFAKKQAVAQAKAAAGALFFGAAWPVWIGTVIGFLTGLFGLAYRAGGATGAAVITMLMAEELAWRHWCAPCLSPGRSPTKLANQRPRF